MAAGAVSRTLPIPGLAEHGIGIKTVQEAAYLRNHVLEQLNIADSTDDPRVRRKALNFVFVGGGFAGAEAIAELEDLARDATRIYPSISIDDLHFYLIEAADRILPEVGPEVGAKALQQLRNRGIDVRLSTFLESAVDQRIKLSDGTEFEAGTLVWTAGVKPSPVVQASDLPLGPKGHVDTTEYLTVRGWRTPSRARQRPSPGRQRRLLPAQRAERGPPGPGPGRQHHRHPARQGTQALPAQEPGAVAGLGMYKGAAQVFGAVKLTGLPAWLAHRSYHLLAVPTFNRKMRVLADWTLGFFLRRDFASIPEMSQPRQAFTEAARPQVDGSNLRRVS